MAYYSLNSASRSIWFGFGAYGRRFYYIRYAFVFFVLSSALIAGVLVGKGAVAIDEARGTVSPPSLHNKAPMAAVASVNATNEVREGQELQSGLTEWVARQPTSNQWSFYVQSLDSNLLVASVNDEQQFELASIYKLFLLKPLASRIPAEAWSNTNVTERNYLACVQAMLSISDNACAEAIAGNLGWSKLQKQVNTDGYKGTELNRTDFLAGTAADTGLVLDRIYHGDGYDARTRQITLDALATAKGAEAVRRTCEGCTVYNKTGDFNGVKHDAAIIEKAGKAYVIVMFSKGAKWSQLVEASQIITTKL